MWKKILWAAVALYPVSIAFTLIENASPDETLLSTILGFLIFLPPLGLLIFELRAGSVSKLWQKLILFVTYLGSLFFLGVGTAGYYAFNTLTPFNILKGLPMIIVLFALFHFAFHRVFKKKAKA